MPAPITAADVARARGRIGERVRRTPVLAVEAGGLASVPVVLKLELLQHTGSFKVRGAFNRVLAATAPPAGLVAASGGNHGLAVAYVAHELGLAAEVFVPAAASAVKVAGIRALGATVRVEGDYYADAYAAMLARAAESGALVVPAYDDPDVAAGQGGVGAELVEQATALDTVLVAVGGGGLIAGIAAALDGRARVVAVEPVKAPTLHAALAAGRPVDVPVSGVAADSLGARRIGELGFAAATRYGVPAVLVEDAAILSARDLLWRSCRVVAEPGGAAALAALVSGAYRPVGAERVAVVVCGANTDPCDLTR